MKQALLEFDHDHIIHPYTSVKNKNTLLVKSAKGVEIELENGDILIDGMSSWWAAIHGYNNTRMNLAARAQIKNMSHIMFGGLTHEPAITLAQNLIKMTDEIFEYVFISDSGSVSVEVALKMALQYQVAKGNKKKTKTLSFYKGYHGDTFGAMSVCDPVNGMHSMFSSVLHQNIFVQEPGCGYAEVWDDKYLDDLNNKLLDHHHEIAAIIIEPIVQGAGGMRFYSPVFLEKLREVCSTYDIVLIFDEIATGFGRTGKMFAYQHSNVTPDIICVGKALTGGYISLAVTMTTKDVMNTIESDGQVLMHGPTFMGNPLACNIANASLDILLYSPWQERVLSIQNQLMQELKICRTLNIVQDVRVLGAIGVVELRKNIDLNFFTDEFVKRGVWIRPFLNLVYIMPPFIIEKDQLTKLTSSIYSVVKKYQNEDNK